MEAERPVRRLPQWSKQMAVAWMGLEMVRFWIYFGIRAKRTC